MLTAILSKLDPTWTRNKARRLQKPGIAVFMQLQIN